MKLTEAIARTEIERLGALYVAAAKEAVDRVKLEEAYLWRYAAGIEANVVFHGAPGELTWTGSHLATDGAPLRESDLGTMRLGLETIPALLDAVSAKLTELLDDQEPK